MKKKNINFIITAHHNDDLYENFFIRLVRGSGLKGLTSFSKTKAKINKKKDIYILRPLLNISKKDLLYVTKNTLNYWINDPSNNKDYFLRIKIRKLLNLLDSEGLSLDKFKLTLKNLYKSNLSIDYYVRQNIKKNSNQLNNKKLIIINETFFKHPDEIVFRSLSELVHIHGNKKNYPRGSKVSSLIENIKNINNFKKMTLSGCIFEKANKSIVITRES